MPTDPIWGIPPDTKEHPGPAFAGRPWPLPPDPWDDIWESIDLSNMVGGVGDTGYTPHALGPIVEAQKSFINGQSSIDGNGHGTHVAGTFMGRGGYGVAPGATLVVAKVLSNGGSGSSAGIAAGIRYMVDQGAHVINLSLGGSSPHQPTNEAIDYAFSRGCWVVAAAGNSGYSGRGSTVGEPARYKSCGSIAAYNEAIQIANFSSGGPEVDIACPGEGILSLANDGRGFKIYSGTSMACPYSAGINLILYYMLLKEGYPIWSTMDDLRQFYKENMRDIGAPGFDVRSGYGIPIIDELYHVLLYEDFKYV